MPTVLTTAHSLKVTSRLLVNGHMRRVRFTISLNIHSMGSNSPPLVAGMRWFCDGHSRWSGWIGSWTLARSPLSGQNFVLIEIEIPGQAGAMWLSFPWSRFRPHRTVISQRQLGDSQHSAVTVIGQRQLGDIHQSDEADDDLVEAWTVLSLGTPGHF